MARRNPMNERYTRDTKVGSTRRSASSLKLKSGSSSASTKKPSAISRARAAAARKSRPSSGAAIRQAMDESPQLKFYNRIWWGLMLTALLTALIMLSPQTKENPSVLPYVWGVWAVSMGLALYVQFGVMKRLRDQLSKAGKDAGKGKSK